MSTEKEFEAVLEMVGNLAKQCIASTEGSASTSSMNRAWWALTDKLSAILHELEEAREDAARYRWLRCDSREAAEIYNFNVDEDLDKAIDAVRKGEA